MSVTENDYEQFVKKWDEIADRYPFLLKDRPRFLELSENQDFVNENCVMYVTTSGFLNLIPEFADKLSPSDLSNYLNRFEEFIEKWKTRPISCWFFDDQAEGLKEPTRDFKEAMEMFFDEILQYQTIKMYPWTTKKEIKRKFDKIRKEQPSWQLRPEQYATNFKIKALREAGWKFTEITKFLESDKQDTAIINKRVKELEKLGKGEKEIDEIIEKEFPFSEVDAAFNLEFQYDAIRKRKKAADYECEKLLKFLKIGK